MSTVLALVLAGAVVGPAAPAARLEGLALVAIEGRVAVRVSYSGRPGPVAVSRSGHVARVTLPRTDLGWRFGAGRRFEWRPGSAPLATFATADRALENLRVEAGRGETSLVLDLPPTVSLEVRRARGALLLVLREGAPPALVAQTPAAPPSAMPVPRTEPVRPEPVVPPTPTSVAEALAPAPAIAAIPEPVEPVELPPAAPQVEVPQDAAPEPSATRVAEATAPSQALPAFVEPALVVPEPPPAAPSVSVERPAEAPAAATLDLYRQLFPPPASAEGTGAEAADVQALYSRLFPGATAERTPVSGEDLLSMGPAGEPFDGFRAGPFRLKPYFTLSYVDADASLLATPDVVGDHYLQLEPGLAAHAPVGLGAFTAEYAPAFRAGASFEATQDASHVLSGTLDLPFAADSNVSITDRYVVSTLDTREVDPGGEYFFDLARFHRNQLSANARLGVAPRFYVELGGAIATTRFDSQGSFFDYDSRLASAGLGYELTPTLRTTVSYVYDDVPEPEERPEAEATAHSVLVTLQGDLLPLLTGRLAVGYRDQDSPNAAAGGRQYQGLSLSGSLTREFGRESTLSLLLNRSTPVSSFEQNGFYVNTQLSASLTAPVPAEMTLDTGLGYAWNDYRVEAFELGAPREDRIFALYAGLRRSFARQWWASAYYRRERRRSNLDAFDVTSDGFLLQVSWGLFGPRR